MALDPTLVESKEFEVAAHDAVLRVRDAFAHIVRSLPGKVSRPHEIEKALGLDKALAWKVSRLIETADPLVASQHMPGVSAVRILIDSARKRDVSATVIREAEDAVLHFESLIRVHAGDRSSLDMMLDSYAMKAGEPIDVEHRKAAFRGNSFIWGVQARTKFTSVFIGPSATEGKLDMFVLYGFVHLRRLRPNVPWMITQSSFTDEDAVARDLPHREAIDPRRVPGSVPLMLDFCSQPLPELCRVPGAPGFVREEIVGGAVGNTGAVTIMAGELVRGVGSRYRDEHNSWNQAFAAMWTPTETLIIDLVVHEDLYGPIRPELLVYSELGTGAQWPVGAPNRLELPVSERVQFLGQGAGMLETKHVPRYREMAEAGFGRLGWDGNRFDVYRVEMKFPPIPSTIGMRHRLPAAP